MCQSPDVRVKEALAPEWLDAEEGSVTAKLRSQGLSTIGTEASLNLYVRRSPIFDVDRETLLLREAEEESEVQLFLFPNNPPHPSPSSAPRRPPSGHSSSARASCTQDGASGGFAPSGARSRVSLPSPGSSKHGRKGTRGLALGILQQDVAGVLKGAQRGINGGQGGEGGGLEGEEGGEGEGGEGGGGEVDLEMLALENKLELIALQRNVSAVKCEIFLDILEAHRRKGRQLPGAPLPPPLPPRAAPGGIPPPPHPLPKSSSRSSRADCGSSDPLTSPTSGAHPHRGSNPHPDGGGSPPARRKVRSSKSSGRHGGRLHKASSLHRMGLNAVGIPMSPLHPSASPGGSHEDASGLAGGVEGQAAPPRASRSRRCYTPQHPLSHSARHAPLPSDFASLSPSPQRQVELPTGRPILPSSSSLNKPPTDWAHHPGVSSASARGGCSPLTDSFPQGVPSGHPQLPHDQRKPRPKPPLAAPPASAQYSDAGACRPYPPVTVPVAAPPMHLSASPGRARESQRGAVLGSGKLPAVQYGGGTASDGAGVPEGSGVCPPQAAGNGANSSQGSSGLGGRVPGNGQGGVAGQAGPGALPMFTGRFSPGQIVPMMCMGTFMDDGEIDPCPSPDDGPRVAPGFENLPKLPPPSFPTPPLTPTSHGDLGMQGTAGAGQNAGAASFSLLHSLPPLPALSLPVPDLGGGLADWSQKALPHLAHRGHADQASATFPEPQFEREQIVPPLPKPMLYPGRASASGKARPGHTQGHGHGHRYAHAHAHPHKGSMSHSLLSTGQLPSAAAGAADAAGAPLAVPTVVPAAGALVTGLGGASQGAGGSAWAFAEGAAQRHIPAV